LPTMRWDRHRRLKARTQNCRWHVMDDLAYNRAMVDIDAEGGVPAPDWPRCTHRSEEADSRCNGRRVDGFDHCLAHLDPEQRSPPAQGPGIAVPDGALCWRGRGLTAPPGCASSARQVNGFAPGRVSRLRPTRPRTGNFHTVSTHSTSGLHTRALCCTAAPRGEIVMPRNRWRAPTAGPWGITRSNLTIATA
jgi:hypothetical protein